MECLSHCPLLESALFTALYFYKWQFPTRIQVSSRPRPYKFASVFFPSWHVSLVFSWSVSWLVLWDQIWRRGSKKQFNWCPIKMLDYSSRQSTSKSALWAAIRDPVFYSHSVLIPTMLLVKYMQEHRYVASLSLSSILYAQSAKTTSNILCT